MTSSGPAGPIQAEVLALPALALLETEWRALEARGAPSFFTSWSWIGTWLECLPPGLHLRLLRATRAGQTLGLAILCSRQVTRAGFVRSRRLSLNATGDAYLDEPTIEYNGLLCEAGQEGAVWQACAAAIMADGEWDEFGVDGLAPVERLEDFAMGNLRREVIERPDCFVDFEALRGAAKPWIEALGQKARSIVKRSLNECREQGVVTFETATTLAQALEYLEGLKRLHTGSWMARGKPGSFANAFFENFHRRLVESRFDEGVIELSRLRIDDRAVGYLYNFRHRGAVYNYQSGFDVAFLDTTAWRPGVVCHAHSIEMNFAQGAATYRFMAGEQRYKRQLTTAATTMAWVTWQRPRWRFAVERMLRGARARLRSRPPSAE